MNQGEILRKHLENKQIGPTEAASLLGYSSRTAMPSVYRRKKFKGDELARIVDSFGNIFDSYTTDSANKSYVKNHPSGRGRPYYDIDVTGGDMIIFDKEIPEYIKDHLYVPGLRDVDFFANVSGDSMDPKFCAGDIIGVKEIKDKSIIQLGEAHVIITGEQRVLKYVRKHPDDDSKWMLHSENNQTHDPFPVEKEKVIRLFLVRGIVKQTTM